MSRLDDIRARVQSREKWNATRGEVEEFQDNLDRAYLLALVDDAQALLEVEHDDISPPEWDWLQARDAWLAKVKE